MVAQCRRTGNPHGTDLALPAAGGRVPETVINGGTIKTPLILLACTAASFYWTDLESDSAVYSMLLPLLDFVLVCSLALWLVARGGMQGVTNSRDSGGFFGGFFDSGGGDGGGCD